MAEKKRSYGCVLGGCLLLLVVGGALATVGLAGGGAWYWLGMSKPAEFGSESALVPAEEPTDLPSLEPEPEEAAAALVSHPQPPSEEQDLDAARSALEEANAYTPPSRPSTSAAASGSQATEPVAAAPEPPAEEPAAVGSAQNVLVEGPASVVLVSSSGRFLVPGRVAPGRYEIEATFPGDQPVKFGNLKVASGGIYTVVCNPRMGICRAH